AYASSIPLAMGSGMLFETISDSIRYPFSRFTRTIFLGILYILSILIIPLFVGLGYCIRLLE
ncbi:hypothetical protein, partial [Serratia marcescens]|uniref:hypothetical protein n=1 Tax=Serratia marcescens TaxID=615 RepID=UPI001954E5CE